MAMIKYFVYVRKSSESEERQILSIEAQLEEVKQFAKKESLFIVGQFAESKTAKEPGRPVFNEMISRIEKGEAQGILAWHPDRLARNSVDGGKIIYLVDTGKIQSLKFPTFWFENTPQGKFMLNIAFGQSKYYVDNLSENTKRGIRQKLRKGEFPCLAPLGYFNDFRTHTIQIDSEKSKYVKNLFELYASGDYSLEDLIKTTEKWGLTNRNGKRLGRATIERILKNPLYYGVIQYKGELYEGKHKTIISKELFDKVQRVFNSRYKNNRKKGKFFVFRGFIKCAECGCMITAETQKGHNYYHCTKKRKPCSQPYIREETLGEQINDCFKEVAIDGRVTNFLLGELERRKNQEAYRNVKIEKTLKDELKQIEIRLDKLLDAHISGLITQEEYHAKKQGLLEQKLEIKAKLKESEQPLMERFEQVRDFIKRCNYARKITLERNFVEQADFLKNAGSNFFLKDKVLSFSWQKPFSFVAEGNAKIKALSTSLRRRFDDSSLDLPTDLSLVESRRESLREAPAGLSEEFYKIWGG